MAPTDTVSPLVIPVVDLSFGGEEAVVTAVRVACTESGFFYVSGHGLSDELIARAFEASKQLFSLPLEEKQALAVNAKNRGWTPLGEQKLDPANQRQGDTKEGYYIGREVPADDPEAAVPLQGPNVWPREGLVPGFRETMMEYLGACMSLGLRLTRLLALSLGLAPEFFASSFTQPMVHLRPLHYAAEVSDPGQGIFGAGAHTDWGMITLLATDDVPGLQVHVNGAWHDVPPKPGCFIINLGDMLQRWTNGLYRSTLHRVVNTTGRERYSIACFLEPNFDARVECLPQCCSAERPPAYPPTTAGQHMLDKIAATHAGNKVLPVLDAERNVLASVNA